MKDLIEYFASKRISDQHFLHWKSNESLRDAFDGIGDLDVLLPNVSENEFRNQTAGVLVELFRTDGASYKRIKDYFYWSLTDGKLAHFHMHFGLDLGSKFAKEYSLPIADSLYSRKELDPRIGVYRTSCEDELILLLIRLSLSGEIDKAKEAEFNWCLNQITPEKLQESIRSYQLSPESEELIFSLIQGSCDLKKLPLLGVLVRRDWKKFKNRSTFDLLKVKWIFQSKKLINKFSHRLFRRGRLKRRLPGKGILLVLVGSDGAGKTTTVKSIQRALNKKIGVRLVYLGNPKASFYGGPTLFKIAKKAGFIPLANLVYKFIQLIRIRLSLFRGEIIVCDRYPQLTCPGIMDGPLLDRAPFLNFLERVILNHFNSLRYDVLIRLVTSAETSSIRGQISLERAKAKTEIVRNGLFGKPRTEISIATDDLSNDPQSVLNQVIKTLFTAIQSKSNTYDL